MALLILAAAPPAPTDWFDRVYTPSGVEVRVDERVLALFAALNAAGLDEGTGVRSLPVPRTAYSPLRAAVRARAVGTPLAAEVDTFLDAHQVPVEVYLAAALGGPAGAVDGLAPLLARAWDGWALAAVMDAERQALRTALREVVGAVEQPLQRSQVALPPVAVVVLNPLDVPGRVRGVTVKGEAFVTVGPRSPPPVTSIVAELLRLALQPSAERVAPRWKEGPAVLREARALGAMEDTPAHYAAAVAARALALAVTEAPAGEWDAAARTGYFVPRDVAQVVREGRAAEVWLLEVLQRVEKARAAKR